MYFGIEDKVNDSINGVPKEEIMKTIEKFLSESENNGADKEFINQERDALHKILDMRCTKEYQQGREDERDRIIKILEDNWLRGTIAHHVIDEIILEIRTIKK